MMLKLKAQMTKQFIKGTRVYKNLADIRHFLQEFEVKPVVFILPVLLGMLSAVFDGTSIGVLVPMFKGIIEADFSFLDKTPIAKNIIASLPTLFGNKNYSAFTYLLGIIIVSVILKNTFTYLSGVTIAFQVRKFSDKVRQKIYERYLSFGKSFFDKSSMGHLHQILIGYAHQVAGTLRSVQGALDLIFVLVVYLVLMWTIEWRLTAGLVLIFPFFHFLMKAIIRKIGLSSEFYAKSYSLLGKQISNAISCIPLVKMYTNEKKEAEKFGDLSANVRRAEFSIDKNTLVIYPVQETVMVFIFLILIGVMAFWSITGKTGGAAGYAVFFILLKRSMASFGVLNNVLASIAVVKGPLNEVKSVFNNKNKYFTSEGDKDFNGLKERIEFNHVDFGYTQERQILKDISVEFKKGETTAVVGATGAGKTTLVSLLLRFYDSSSGVIKLDDVDIKEFTLKSLRGHIALVSQEVYLFNESFKANLIYGLTSEPEEKELWSVITKARLTDYVKDLPEGLETRIGDRGVQLSGGEKQRLSIARAILKKAEILILDEATSALDTRTERMVQEAINVAIEDKTAIIIAHRLSTIQHADRIIVLEEGRVVETGSLDGLLAKKGKFFSYWEEQKFY